MINESTHARRVRTRRAFSLFELIAVLAIIGLVGSTAYLRFGNGTLATTSGEGFARSLALDLRQARSRTISTGDDHYVLLHRTAGVVDSYTLYRDAGGGDLQVDRQVEVPAGVTVTSLADQWNFDFDGSVSGGSGAGAIVVAGPHHTWTITVFLATGSVRTTEASLP